MSRAIGLIPARFGSNRFPGKPLAQILKKSLIQRTYESVRKSEQIGEVMVATDDQRIFEHVESFGGKAVMTSPDCQTGTDRLAEAARDLPDDTIIVNVQGDWPCIDPHVIDGVIELLDGDAVMGTAVFPITSQEELRRSSLVKCVMDQTGNALYFSRSPIPHGGLKSAYGHLGLYSYRNHFLQEYAKLPQTPLQIQESLEQLKALEHGFSIRVLVTEKPSLSVDRPEDIQRVEEYLCSLNSYS